MQHPLAALLLAIATPVLAQAPGPAPQAEISETVSLPVTTYHTARVDGQKLSYSATVGETVLTDAGGRPAATIFATAYIRSDVADPQDRPVLFAFNGGPGSSSGDLHLAFGPRRSSRSADIGAHDSSPPRMVDNAQSLLDVADLVFIDPVGTGFARVLPGGHGRDYWSVTGDASSVASFIRNWLKRNGRERSPVFICGESYGGMRLGALLGADASGIPISGAIFISPVLDPTATAEAIGNDLPYVLALPTMAAIAWYHGRVTRDGRTLVQVFDDARRFAETQYDDALLQGAQLPAREERWIAREVAQRIGLPEQTILRDDLRVPIEHYVLDLLAPEGLRVGRIDGRYSGPAAQFARNSPPFDDPSIDPAGSDATLLRDYFVEDLTFKTARPYVTLAMSVNSQWTWDLTNETHSFADIAPSIATAMRANGHLRVLVAGGYYDLAVPVLATAYALDHSGAPLERVTQRYYPAGHMLYQSEAVRQELAADIRAFVRGSMLHE